MKEFGGNGVQRFQTPNIIYEGQVCGFKACEHGRLILAAKGGTIDYYEGNFATGEFEGQGTYYSGTKIIEGTWAAGALVAPSDKTEEKKGWKPDTGDVIISDMLIKI